MEKSGQGEGYINAGCYYVPREVMIRFTEKSSLERICFLGLRANLYLRGITGDVLGAIAFASELLFLLGILCIFTGVP